MVLQSGCSCSRTAPTCPALASVSNVYVPWRRKRAIMGASMSRLLSSSNAPKASSDNVPHRSGLLELVIAANGRTTLA